MKRLVFPASMLLFGLGLCQVLFTALVYVSNHRLHAELTGMKAAGYLVVPNELVMPSLLQFMPAFCGALFFTVTIGAGLTLAAFFAAWAQKRLLPGSRVYPAVLAASWLALLIACNLQGWNLQATSVFLLVPPAVFAAARTWMPPARTGDGRVRAAHIIVVAITAVAWIPCLQQDVFISIRDYILLSNPAGKQVNAFYYSYTLYPANMIQPLANKLIKPCLIKTGASPARYRQIAGRLIAFDYLPIAKDAPAGITIRSGNDRLQFAADETVLLETGLQNFLSDPGQTLKTVSVRADTNRFFRRASLYGLIAAFPLGLYILVHAGLCILLVFVRSIAGRGICAAVICLGLAAVVLIPLYAENFQSDKPSQIQTALHSDSWHKQRDALKTISAEGRSPGTYNIGAELAESPHVPVRYWLARALGNSRSADNRDLLKTLTADPSPNVACMAYAGLGRLGGKQTVDFIKNRIREIPHWYVQQYAYNAMRRLGWKQKRSDTRGNRLP
ncbi:MAG: HEAT repeat domain-containing protein [Desulfobacteraceae bacterium]|nr:HEAT repeat domain-containing protein [Desulfobacteraceae bacterium]